MTAHRIVRSLDLKSDLVLGNDCILKIIYIILEYRISTTYICCNVIFLYICIMTSGHSYQRRVVIALHFWWSIITVLTNSTYFPNFTDVMCNSQWNQHSLLLSDIALTRVLYRSKLPRNSLLLSCFLLQNYQCRFAFANLIGPFRMSHKLHVFLIRKNYEINHTAPGGIH